MASAEGFFYKKIPNTHKIVLESREGLSEIKLSCGGRINNKYTKEYKVGICESHFNGNLVNDLEEFEIHKNMNEDVYFGDKFELEKVEGKICFVGTPKI